MILTFTRAQLLHKDVCLALAGRLFQLTLVAIGYAVCAAHRQPDRRAIEGTDAIYFMLWYTTTFSSIAAGSLIAYYDIVRLGATAWSRKFCKDRENIDIWF